MNITAKIDDSEMIKLAAIRDSLPTKLMLGLADSVRPVVEAIKGKAPVKTGALRDSIMILDFSSTSDKAEVVIGSTIDGYPFYQEYGWTSRSGRPIRGKRFFRDTIEATVGQVGDGVISNYGGSV